MKPDSLTASAEPRVYVRRFRGFPPRLLGLLLILFMFAPAPAQLLSGPRRPSPRDVTFEQRLGERVPLDARFRDDAGRDVTLAAYFNDRPVLLVLAYYRCPMLCTLVLNGVGQGLREVPFVPGKDFEVVVISIDPRETPDLAAEKKLHHLARYGRPETADGWHFLTGEEPQIRRVADAVGFRYAYDEPTGQYAHPAGITFLTGSGVVSRYLFNSAYEPIDMRLALADAGEGKIGNFLDTLAQVCFQYDPLAGRYGVTIRTAMRIGGALTLLGLACLIGGLWWRGRRAEKRFAISDLRFPIDNKDAAQQAPTPPIANRQSPIANPPDPLPKSAHGTKGAPP